VLRAIPLHLFGVILFVILVPYVHAKFTVLVVSILDGDTISDRSHFGESMRRPPGVGGGGGAPTGLKTARLLGRDSCWCELKAVTKEYWISVGFPIYKLVSSFPNVARRDAPVFGVQGSPLQ